MVSFKDLDKEHLLDALGLQLKRDAESGWGPVIGAAVGGMIVGAVLALILSPKSGSELRGSLRDLVMRKKQEDGQRTTGGVSDVGMPDTGPRY